MSGFKQWLHNLGQRISVGLRQFMQGRYGTDKLNTTILVAGLVLCILAMLIPLPLVSSLVTLGSYVLVGWALFRCLSRKTYKRYEENRKYLMFLQRLKDREHRYFDCPRCRQPVRVPSGKGKIEITCPKCKEKFIKKT